MKPAPPVTSETAINEAPSEATERIASRIPGGPGPTRPSTSRHPAVATAHEVARSAEDRSWMIGAGGPRPRQRPGCQRPGDARPRRQLHTQRGAMLREEQKLISGVVIGHRGAGTTAAPHAGVPNARARNL